MLDGCPLCGPANPVVGTVNHTRPSFAHPHVDLTLHTDPPRVSWRPMPVPRVDQTVERPFEDLAQKASQQAVVLAREQVDVARRELTARAREAGPGVAMIGGGAVLTAL